MNQAPSLSSLPFQFLPPTAPLPTPAPAFVPPSWHPAVHDNGSEAGSGADEDDVEVTGVTGDEINNLGWALVCTMVGCRRPSNLTTEFYDEQGRCSTDTICCYEGVTGEGHTAVCDATAADAEDDVNDGDDDRVRVGHTNEDIDRVFVGIANQLRALHDADDDDDDFRRQLRDLSANGAPDP